MGTPRLPALLAGDRFGRLRVIAEVLPKPRFGRRYRLRCDCGGFTESTDGNLRAGDKQSCGCLRLEVHTRHGHAGRGNTPTYNSWVAMRNRCYYKNADNYHRYGGSGIEVCEPWRKDFKTFLADMGERPAGMTLDRIDSNGNYEPSNCRWATTSMQALNSNNRAKGWKRNNTHCSRGHEFASENVPLKKDGSRICRICQHEWASASRQRRALKDAA